MSSENTNTNEQPSMVGGHAKYVQGAISSLMGNTESGEQTKSEAVDQMRRANDQSSNEQPAQSGILGTIEKKAGELAGCEGMEKEGQERLRDQQ